MNDVQRQVQKKRQALRWRVLNACYHGKPGSVGEVIVLRICVDTGFEVDMHLIYEALDYLEGKELITVQRRAVEWLSRITDEGTDVVEGNAVCPPGIDKPEW